MLNSAVGDGPAAMQEGRRMKTMTTAERRGYQQITGADGLMMVIACDQRGGMRSLLSDDPAIRAGISDADLGVVKADIVRYLANHASSVLLDPTCAVPGVVDDGVLARDVALIVGLDASGYDTDSTGRRLSRLAKGITARRVRELGGTAGKIMVYLRADGTGTDAHNIAILRQCVEDFAREDMLLVVEFLTYELEGEDKAVYRQKIPTLVEAGTRVCLDCGAKVLKLPYPGTAAACANITAMAGDVPWAVLSAGVDHETFLGQITIAMANGASGVIGGRALWKDCISLDRAVTRERLTSRALPRLREIQALIGRYAKPVAA